MRRIILAPVMGSLALGLMALLFVQVPAGATGPTTVATLGPALCGGATVTLEQDIDESSTLLTVAGGCIATLDLNGHTLTVSRVVLGAGADLTIRDTSASADGQLIAQGAVNDEAGIRTTGATLRIVSGTVSATGGAFGAGIGGRRDGSGGIVTVSGGMLTATGGRDGAGIGGGLSGSGGTVSVSDGMVMANGGQLGAGIGGGNARPGGAVTVTGGKVTARGGSSGAGIGGGNRGAGGTVTISGGTVTATGGSISGAGIGGGDRGSLGTVTISGGMVTATGGDFAAGIGGGPQGSGGTITVTGGTVTATGRSNGAGIGGGQNGEGGTVTISGGTVTATSGFTSAFYGIGPGSGRTAGVVTIGPGLIRTDTEPTAGQRRTTLTPVPEPETGPAPVPVLALSCASSVPVVGSPVTCTVSGGDPELDILWRAAYNPVIAEQGVTLDANGSGEFSFVVPAAAVGEVITVELVEWLAPMSLGTADGPTPASVPTGSGPVPVWPVLLLALTGGLALRRRSGSGWPPLRVS